MAKQAPLLSKCSIFISLLMTLYGCHQQTDRTGSIPVVFVATNHPGWQQREGRLWLNGKPFSGWQYQLWPKGDTAFVGAFYKGKAEGAHRQWYENHRPREIRYYLNGWQEGQQRGWFESGKRAFVYHFLNDVYEGNCQEWYANGRPAQDKNYAKGQESGPQRMWFADGNLKVNYVARNGRNYGFTGVNNCVNVWDSIAVSN